MAEVMERRPGTPLAVSRVPVRPDEAAARRTLREQIARLEGELGALFCSTYPRTGFDWHVPSRGGPRVLSLVELEQLRDELLQRLEHNRRMLSDRTYVEELNRRRIEEMLLAPDEHKWVVIRNEDIGERGCKSWHVRPRFGLLGMLMNWWRVRISSGCPLAGGRGPRPRPLNPVVSQAR
ncbi:MAG: hypothetical protein E6G29_01530 [Actinobacteria bacterium]|nr:MAG: hypothetical protein E6G29_01530 [Actinomycetota bacterium]